MRTLVAACLLLLPALADADGDLAVRGGVVHTMAGPAIADGVVLVQDGRITRVGPAGEVRIPDGWPVLEAAVVTPGLIDAHATVGLTGILNVPHDQDMLETSAPVQPELRALDAYNPLEPLVAWVRSFGVTMVHTGHAPGPPLSGQTMLVRTTGNTVEEALVEPAVAVAVTLSPTGNFENSGKLFTTRAKTVAVLRQDLIGAQEYRRAQARKDRDERPPRDLRLETLARVLDGELALMVTAHRVRDITNALRLAEEFGVRMWLDGAAEAHQVLPLIRDAGVPVLLHPTMSRPAGELENASYETASLLREAGIPFAFTSGYESYVPKVRVVLLEAAVAAGHGLGFEGALAALTIDAARILGLADRVGSLEKGKDGDLALYDGDPFEYTTHCVGVVIAGEIVSDVVR